jgi:signal transduction histidine kinase
MTTFTELPPLPRPVRLEDQLAAHAARLARRNQALEDYAALVAHDVRSTLLAALRSDEPRAGLTRSLELVDSILDAVRAEQARGDTRSVAACARAAIDDLGNRGTNLLVTPGGPFPLPPATLRVALRNLFANAVAAGATRIHVATPVWGGSSLIVDDNGCGLAGNGSDTAANDAVGAGLGLSLCQRLLSRFNATLSLTPGPVTGVRATIVAPRA